jgi:4-amino-4-deoxy-L-arabinose transferase-like glycosyltransferase
MLSGWRWHLVLLSISAAVFLPWLGDARSLTEHEAYLAGSARQMFNTGQWLVPAIGDLPWLERPVLSHWLIILSAEIFGWNEFAARLPSALAAAAVVTIVASLGARFFGRPVGLIAGVVQATTVYTITYARLAEADILLAAIVVGAIAAVAHIDSQPSPAGWRGWVGGRWAWLFWGLAGLSNLVKSPLFGAILIAAVVGPFLLWHRNFARVRKLLIPGAMALAIAIGAAWPIAILALHPAAACLWQGTLLARAHGDMPIYIEPWWYYATTIPWQLLPWTPFAILGAIVLWRRRRIESLPASRLLACWAFIPPLLLSFSKGKHHHYLIHSLPALSIVTAVGVNALHGRMVERLKCSWTAARGSLVAFAVICIIASAIIHARVLPIRDRSREDRAFYREVNAQLPAGAKVYALGGPEIARHIFYIVRPVEGHLHPRHITGPAYVIARAADEDVLNGQIILQSRHTRLERSPADRFTLFHLPSEWK